MRIYDYECYQCEKITEVFVTGEAYELGICPHCSGVTHKIISMSHTAPLDSTWISGVRNIVDKKSKEPHNTEFLKHPSRANYNEWKKKTGLRHLEPGEGPTKVDKEAGKKAMKKKMINKIQDRNSITIRG